MEDLDSWLKELSKTVADSVDSAITSSFKKNHPDYVYESIEDYTSKTGKRFRMNKSQKNRGLNREQAFNETYTRQE